MTRSKSDQPAQTTYLIVCADAIVAQDLREIVEGYDDGAGVMVARSLIEADAQLTGLRGPCVILLNVESAALTQHALFDHAERMKAWLVLMNDAHPTPDFQNAHPRQLQIAFPFSNEAVIDALNQIAALRPADPH